MCVHALCACVCGLPYIIYLMHIKCSKGDLIKTLARSYTYVLFLCGCDPFHLFGKQRKKAGPSERRLLGSGGANVQLDGRPTVTDLGGGGIWISAGLT